MMTNISDLETDKQMNVPNNYRLETPKEQAKITGLLCIGCAVIAVFLGAFVSLGGFLSYLSLTLYFVFVLLSAVFGLIGYSEIKALGNGLTSSIFLLLSIALLFVSFLAIPIRSGNIKFGIIYGLSAVFIPIMLVVLTLITNKVALWKAFVPLAIPLLHLAAYPLIGSTGFPLAALLLPLGWGLLGMVVYQKRG